MFVTLVWNGGFGIKTDHLIYFLFFFFFFFLRINGRILFKERINLYKNKEHQGEPKKTILATELSFHLSKKQQLYARLHQGKPKIKNETILQLLKTSFHN